MQRVIQTPNGTATYYYGWQGLVGSRAPLTRDPMWLQWRSKSSIANAWTGPVLGSFSL